MFNQLILTKKIICKFLTNHNPIKTEEEKEKMIVSHDVVDLIHEYLLEFNEPEYQSDKDLMRIFKPKVHVGKK